VGQFSVSDNTLDQMLAAKGVDIEALVTDFKVARKKAVTLKKLSTKTA
jgi:hypothetical protein